jgi:hypothetical protein
MSSDEHPWDREDEEIRKAFAAKDAEIAGLQDELKIAASKTDVQAYDRMLEELAEKAAEIERLKGIISELAGALNRAINILSDQGHYPQTIDELSDPLQRARETTKDE